MFTSKKYQKPVRTKFRKNKDLDNEKLKNKKHHDKSTWRLMREEREDYVV
jgi:hypothetical protein